MNLANAKLSETSAKEPTTVADVKDRPVRGEMASPKAPDQPQAAEVNVDSLGTSLHKLAAPSITEIEDLVLELQAARDYLKSERTRLENEIAQYARLSETASASVRLVSDGLGQWRKASRGANLPAHSVN